MQTEGEREFKYSLINISIFSFFLVFLGIWYHFPLVDGGLIRSRPYGRGYGGASVKRAINEQRGGEGKTVEIFFE